MRFRKLSFNYSALRKFRSKGCYYEPKGQVSWGSLRKLTITLLVMSDDVFQKVLLGSPMLECLKLKDVRIGETCDEIFTIDLSSNSWLERLVIERN